MALRLRRFPCFAAVAVAVGLIVAPVWAQEKPGAKPEEKPAPPAEVMGKPIDLVICLDVSGSMNGLIDSAKIRLWDVVNELARMKPTPNLRVGLYTYGATRYPAEPLANRSRA